jgi:hypothetical protein
LQCIEKTGIQTAAVTELGFSPEMHTWNQYVAAACFSHASMLTL